MKIAIVIERFDPEAGGAERSTAQIAGELVGRGHAVTVLAGSSPLSVGVKDYQGMGVKVMLGDGGRFKSAGHVRRFEGWVREELSAGGFDTSLSVTTNAPARVVQPRGGTVLEVRERNLATRGGGLSRLIKRLSVALSPKQRAVAAAERRTLSDPMVKRFVAVSDYVVRQFAGHYGITGERVVVIPNAAAMPKVGAGERAEIRARVRAELGLKEGDVAFLFAAFNPRLKGIDTLLKALALRKEDGRAVALCAGEFGRREKGLAERLGVMERVRDLGPGRKMAELYVAADVTVLPSYYDPSSKVIIESLMMGVPAISTSYNGSSDMIIEKATGVTRGRVIAEPSDERALAMAMRELEQDDERARCGAACVGLSEKLSMKVHVDALEVVLREG
jgi:UDP-glucose:(heptosyl)LPS alpha-1,3-glucosyltransferase